MSFKTQFIKDLSIVMNDDEFAETHIIDGQAINCIVDNDRLIDRSKKEYDGISVGEILIFLKVEDMNKAPREGNLILFDNRQMQVFSVREDMGMYEVILTQNMG